MANASPIDFTPETPARAKAKVTTPDVDAPAVAHSAAPQPGDKFNPVRGKTGTYHALGGEAAGILVAIVTH